jgi:natural product precursor
METKTKLLSKIKLNELSMNELELKKREMTALKGGSGGSCVCVCLENSYPTAGRPIAEYTNSAT